LKARRLALVTVIVVALLVFTVFVAVPRPPTVTPFTSDVPRDPTASSFSSNWYRNGSLWASLDRAYQGKWYAGTDTKVLWYRSDNLTFDQRLVVTGMRIDANSTNTTVLGNRFPVLYSEENYQPSSLLFPSEGYWRVIGKIGNLSLSFIVHVYPHSDCHLPDGLCT